MRRLLLFSIGLTVAITGCSIARASDDLGGIDLIDVSGPLDVRALDFVSDSIELAATQGKDLAVVQVNSRAVLNEAAADRLETLLETPPVPVAVWVGPSPAVAFGATFWWPSIASHGAIAPGSEIGHQNPRILGVDRGESDESLAAEETGLDLQPTFRQYLQDLDGATFDTQDGPVVVETLQTTPDGGVTTKNVTFRKPGLITRFLRLGITPEAAFFFLTMGLTMAIFEFYALGPGVAAGVATLALIPGIWGVFTLPTKWWAIGLLFLAFVTLVTGHQRGGLVGYTLVGAVLLQVSGMFLIDGGGQIDPRWWLVLLSVLMVLFFFLLAMPTVQRARLSSETVGREGLIGHVGVAQVDFDPDGLVMVEGARWRGTAHREAGINKGDSVVVTGVDGLFLEVERETTERET